MTHQDHLSPTLSVCLALADELGNVAKRSIQMASRDPFYEAAIVAQT